MSAFTPVEALAPDAEDLARVVATALREDLRYGRDVTTEATVPATAVAVAEFTPRRPGVLAGVPAVRAVLDAVLAADGYDVLEQRADGTRVRAGEPALRVRAPVRGLLTAERTALNLLCHLSGVATATAAFVDALAGTGTRILDTRKTLPGLRLLQKYAVRCGGGVNHRFGLGDAALIKDNHVVAAGGIVPAIEAVRAAAPSLPLEVECDTLDQVRAALDARCDLILLDNMDPPDLRAAVAMARRVPGVRLEASGGLTLGNAREVASTGVDFVAVGGLTHSSPALDLGLDLRES